jgi:hypothetical protein
MPVRLQASREPNHPAGQEGEIVTQVSGSIALEFGKVVRDTVNATVAELTRTHRTDQETEHNYATPLETIVDKVTERVAQLTSADLLRIERKLDHLSQMQGPRELVYDNVDGRLVPADPDQRLQEGPS